jgi:hypothetical protein
MKENTVQWIMYYYLLEEAVRKNPQYEITITVEHVGMRPYYYGAWCEKIQKLVEVQRIYEYERDSGEFVRYFPTDTDIMILDNAAPQKTLEGLVREDTPSPYKIFRYDFIKDTAKTIMAYIPYFARLHKVVTESKYFIKTEEQEDEMWARGVIYRNSVKAYWSPHCEMGRRLADNRVEAVYA